MTENCDVLVAIPARDEAERVERCLCSVIAAVTKARRTGRVGRARIAVAAHRCTDDTVGRARSALDEAGIDSVVVEIDDEIAVGSVRTRLARVARAAEPALGQRRLWLFSTDADSTVPHDWVTGHLETAARTGAAVVAGMVDLVGWRGGRAARRAYRNIIAAGLLPDGGHTHVYAANLAVRWTSFEMIGGFPGVAQAEEAELIRTARAAGLTVATPRQPRVRTSGRVPGRAADGLGAMLGSLSGGSASVAVQVAPRSPRSRPRSLEASGSAPDSPL